MAPIKIRLMDPTPKRTRVSRGQSKNGCFTCKSRKVKCDEEKPFCTRCRNARIQCDGYPVTAYLSPGRDSRSSSSASSRTAREPRRGSIEQSEPASLDNVLPQPLRPDDNSRPQLDLFQVGLDLLLNSYEDHFVMGQALLRKLLTQYSTSSPSLRAACAALGAATELQKQPIPESDQLHFQFATHYGSAIRLIRQELGDRLYDSNSIVATCIVLGSIDHIRRRHIDAALHLRGAHQAFRSNFHFQQEPNPAFQLQSTTQGNSIEDTILESDLLLRLFDLQNLTATKGKSVAVIEPLPFDVLEQIFSEAQHGELPDSQVVPTAHAVGAFIATAIAAIRATLSGASAFKIDVQFQRCVNLTERWSSLLNFRLAGTISGHDRIRLLVIRNWFQCCGIILKSQFIEGRLNDDETAWDNYHATFRQIVEASEEIIEAQLRTRQNVRRPDDVLGFTPMIGISQPLFLVARKYRHRTWRRRAIACLRRLGREGPWIGEMMATIAERVVQIEESSVATFGSISPSNEITDELGMSIPASTRISMTYLVENASHTDGASWPSADSGSVEVEFWRRTKPNSLMSDLLFTTTAVAAGQDSNRAANLGPTHSQEGEWECWTEHVVFSAASTPNLQWSSTT